MLSTIVIATLGATSILAADAQAVSAPDGQPRIRPAPALPRLPAIPDKAGWGKVTSRSVPAAASVATGIWVEWDEASGRSTGTQVSMPSAGGSPLLGDWNGDGVATPGRYENGEWFITNAAVNSPSWESHATFGGDPGDIPVVGRLDKDKRFDIGVFRDGLWRWQRANGKPAKESRFGSAGDIPVVGDWDGDRRDDIGVVRSGQWILRVTGLKNKKAAKALVGKGITVTKMRPKGTFVLTFPFGSFGDLPVVGDWNRDGRDEPGIVQDRSVWVLSGGLDRLRRTTKESHRLADDQVPLVGNQATGPGHCPSATRGGEKYGKATARLVTKPRTPKGQRTIEGNQEVLATMQDGLRYVVTNDLTKRLRSRVGMAFYDPLSTHPSIEESVRRSANSALAASIALTTSKWPRINGISKKELRDYARWNIRSLACQHGAVSPGGWGNTWQSALWAVTVGQAGWMLWPKLNDQERALVSAMVVSEADYASARGPRYFKNRLGQDIAPGDSQADEVSWDLLAPALALAMMPAHPHASTWRDSMIAMAIAAFARPGDLTKVQTVNGVRPDIQLPGINANEDGTITNHGIVNPDYIQNVEHLWWAASLLRSGGQPVPEALFLNADVIYRALSSVEFTSPPYAEPGGTVYQPAGQIYYPMGVGWGTRRPATFVGVDAFANAYAAADVRAGENLAAHARDARALQLRWTDGHMYADGPSEESYRLGKEEYALQQMSLAWWASAVKTGLRMTVDTTAYPGISLGTGTPLP